MVDLTLREAVGDISGQLPAGPRSLYFADNDMEARTKDAGDLDITTTVGATWIEPTTGNIRTATATTDAREEAEGIRIEAVSRTNELLRNRDYTNAAWTKGGDMIATAPGTQQAPAILASGALDTGEKYQLLTSAAGGAGHHVRQSAASFTDTSQKMSISAFVREIDSDAGLRLIASGGTGVDIESIFNFTAETFSGTGAADSTFFKMPDGGYLLTLTVAMNGTNASINGRIFIDAAGSINVWASQLEDSPVPTIVIHTTAAAVTIPGDIIKTKPIGNASNAGMDFTYLMEFSVLGPNTAASQWFLSAALEGLGSSFVFGIAMSTSGALSVFCFSSESIITPVQNFDEIIKIAVTYDHSITTLSVYINGGFVGDRVITQAEELDLTANEITFGKRSGSTTFATEVCHLKNYANYLRVLTPTEILNAHGAT